MNLRFVKVKASSRIGAVMIPWNNRRPDAEKRNLGGSTENCILTGLRRNNESDIELQWLFVSPHIQVSITHSSIFSAHLEIFSF
jgi:hypothetical protein